MNLLSIGGSDPTSGAGIQSDVKTFAGLNVHPLTVVTAITSQNTKSFGTVKQVSRKMLTEQLESVISDFKIDGIKISMVFSSGIIRILHRHLKGFDVPIVVDPVIRSTTGGRLMQDGAIQDYQKYIVPLATVITPNQFEAEVLTGTKINGDDTSRIARIIQKMGAKNIIVTGIDRDKKISDFILEEGGAQYTIPGRKISRVNHGSGCNYSAAVLFAMAEKKTLRQSAKFAKKFAYNSIKNARYVGSGMPITDVQIQNSGNNSSSNNSNSNNNSNNNNNNNNINSELSSAINEFTKIRGIYRNIPQCQTNFVYAKQRPKSRRDVLGISGRIVRAGGKVIVAGNLSYGGSKHVTDALLAVNKKFPQIRSAVNLRYQDAIISKINQTELTVSSYDRMQEPNDVKSHKSTIQWGINNAIRDLEEKGTRQVPDVVFHKGDFGKEPMVIIFGDTPKNVLEKLSKIL